MNTNNNMHKIIGRTIALTYYSIQDARIKFKNQMRDIVRKKSEGIPFDKKEDKKEKKNYGKKYQDDTLIPIMEQLLLERKITQEEYDFFDKCWSIVDGWELNKMNTCPHCERRFKSEVKVGGISEIEKHAINMMKKFIQNEPIYREFLSKIKGIGPVYSSNLIKNFGYCETYETVSKLWAHTGHSVDIEGKLSKPKRGEKLHYEPKLRSLTYNISNNLLKGNKGYYKKTYYEEKKKQLEKEYPIGYLANKYNGYKNEDIHLTPLHAHNRALRKVRKHFLAHYWEACHELIGLPINTVYAGAILGHDHIISWREAVAMEGTYFKTEELEIEGEGEIEE